MAEKQFADGLRFELPGEKAPAWVKGKISIKADAFIKFLEANKNERGWVNLDVKESKGGNIYVELNTYSSQKPPTDSGGEPPQQQVPAGDYPF